MVYGSQVFPRLVWCSVFFCKIVVRFIGEDGLNDLELQLDENLEMIGVQKCNVCLIWGQFYFGNIYGKSWSKYNDELHNMGMCLGWTTMMAWKRWLDAVEDNLTQLRVKSMCMGKTTQRGRKLITTSWILATINNLRKYWFKKK